MGGPGGSSYYLGVLRRDGLDDANRCRAGQGGPRRGDLDDSSRCRGVLDDLGRDGQDGLAGSNHSQAGQGALRRDDPGDRRLGSVGQDGSSRFQDDPGGQDVRRRLRGGLGDSIHFPADQGGRDVHQRQADRDGSIHPRGVTGALGVAGSTQDGWGVRPCLSGPGAWRAGRRRHATGAQASAVLDPGLGPGSAPKAGRRKRRRR